MLILFYLICSWYVTSADYDHEIHEAGHVADCFTKATKGFRTFSFILRFVNPLIESEIRA